MRTKPQNRSPGWMENRRENFTTIAIRKSTRARIHKFRIINGESYDETLNRIMSSATKSGFVNTDDHD